MKNHFFISHGGHREKRINGLQRLSRSGLTIKVKKGKKGTGKNATKNWLNI